MLKRFVALILGFVAGLAGNLVAGWLQQDLWTNLFTLPRLGGTVIGAILVLLTLAMLDSEETLAWNWWWHRIWYLQELLNDPSLRRWEKTFAQLQLARGRRQMIGSTVKFEGERRDLIEALQEVVVGPRRESRVLVLGEPGSGKTTGLEQLTLEMARRSIRRLGIGGSMPILVRLGNFQEGKLLAYIGQEMRGRARGKSGKVLSKGVEKLIEQGRVVLLFDALDESLGVRREVVLAELANLLTNRAYEDVAVVATSRTRGDVGGQLAELPILEIQDMSDEAVETFVRTYKQPEVREEKIIERLARNQLLEPRGLGRNPFWLRLIVESGVFKGGKGQILDSAVDTLLAREWDKPKTGRSWQRRASKEEQLRGTKRALGWLAYRMTEKNQFELAWDQALAELEKGLGARVAQYLSPRDVLGLGQDAQILTYDPQTVCFRHRLLQEFMTAWALVAGKVLDRTDTYTPLEGGLRQFLSRLQRTHPRYSDALVFEQRLRENITLSRQHGETGSHKAERSQIIEQLNKLALTTIGVSFNELCAPTAVGKEVPLGLPQKRLEHYLQDSDRWEILLMMAGLISDPRPFVQSVLADGLDPRRLFLAIGMLGTAEASSEELEQRARVALIEHLRQGVTVEQKQAAADVVKAAGEEALKLVRGILSNGDDSVTVKRGVIEIWGALGSSSAAETLAGVLEDDALRDLAVDTLVHIGKPATGPLTITLAHEKSKVRKAAIESLGRIQDTRATNPLIAAFQDVDEDVRKAAVCALEHIGPPAVAPLIAQLESKDDWGHCEAAEALGKIGDTRAVVPLIRALQVKDFQSRAAVAEALGRIGDVRAADPLIAVLKGQDIVAPLGVLGVLRYVKFLRSVTAPLDAVVQEGVQVQVAVALGEIGDVRAVGPLIAALGYEGIWTHMAVVSALEQIGDSAVVPLIAALEDENSDVRKGAAETLGKIGDNRAVEALLATLGDPDSGVRVSAAVALEEIGDDRAIGALIDTLQDKEQEVRRGAIEALGQIADARAAEPLISALGDEWWEARWAAAKALGKIGDRRAVTPLIAALKDEDSTTRWVAAEALGLLGDVRAVGPLIDMLGDEGYRIHWRGDWNSNQMQGSEVYGAAIWALAKIGGPAVDPLIATLGGDDRTVSSRAAEALGKIGELTIVPLMAALQREDGELRHNVSVALRHVGKPATGHLIAALQDRDDEVRKEVAWTLGRIGDPQAVDSLTAMLQDEQWELRYEAASALGRIRAAWAVDPLITALRDRAFQVRYQAACALGWIGDVRAVDALVDALGDQQFNVSLAAADALKQIGEPAVEALVTALRNEHSGVRQIAAWALGQIGGARVVEPLLAALEDADESVRQTATETLERMGIELAK